MKVFEIGLENAAFFGVQWQESLKRYVYNSKYFAFHLAACGVGIIGTVLFLVYDAKTFFDFTFGLMLFTIPVMYLIVCVSFYFHMDIFNEFIEKCNKQVNESE